MKHCALKELASAYNPHILPKSATKRLNAWIDRVPHLRARLRRAGWSARQRVLTPRMVQMIEDALGEV